MFLKKIINKIIIILIFQKKKIGDIVDGLDSSNVWYNCTILDKKVEKQTIGEEIIEIFICYRTYNEKGDKIDSEGRRYSGWSQKYDEWINVTSPRIHPKDKFSKKLYLKASTNDSEDIIDDSNDHV